MFLAKTNQTMKTSSRPKTDFWELCFATVYGASGKYVTYGAKRWRRLCSNSESVGFPLPGYGFSKSRCRGIATQQKIRSAQCRAGVGFGISHIYFSYIYIYIYMLLLSERRQTHTHTALEGTHVMKGLLPQLVNGPWEKNVQVVDKSCARPPRKKRAFYGSDGSNFKSIINVRTPQRCSSLASAYI